LNSKVYSSFVGIYINPVIYDYSKRLGWVMWCCDKGFAWVGWLIINIARVGAKVWVGLENDSKMT